MPRGYREGSLGNKKKQKQKDRQQRRRGGGGAQQAVGPRDVEALMGRAQHALEIGEVEEAEGALRGVLGVDAHHVEAMDMLAEVCVGKEDVEGAVQLLQTAVGLSQTGEPTATDAYRWLQLGQLQAGAEALHSLQTGIQIIQARMAGLQVRERPGASGTAGAAAAAAPSGTAATGATADNGEEAIREEGAEFEDDDEELDVLRTKLCSAFCSIGELYMTDLCDEADAEQQCELAVQSALEASADSVDAKLALANLRMNQQRPEEAVQPLKEIARAILRPSGSGDGDGDGDGKAGGDDTDAQEEEDDDAGATGGERDIALLLVDDFSPGVSLRIAQSLVECAEVDPTCVQPAMDILDILLQQDDENIELWYTMGIAAMSSVPQDRESALLYFTRAQEMLSAIAKAMHEYGEDFPYTDHVQKVEYYLAELQGTDGDGSSSFSSGAASAVAGGALAVPPPVPQTADTGEAGMVLEGS